MSAPLLLAFGFGNLAMLGWLAAAAAPVLIHLWSRRKYQQMPWAAMEYLLAAMRETTRRLRLEQWLLLAVRTLLVVAVVLAVAEPYFHSMGLSMAAGQRTHRVLVIDGSYSMGYRPTNKSRFEKAKELATRIVEESPQGDGFTLILMAAPPRVVVGTPALGPGGFLQEIDGLQLAHTTADLPATLARVEEVLAAARREQPKLVAAEVYFITDLCRVGWMPDSSSPAATTAYRERAERLAQSAELVVLDVGQADAENVAVTSARTLEPYTTLGQNVSINAEVRSFGRQAISRQPVELLADGRHVAQEHVELAPGGQATASFSYRFETPGDHFLEIRAPGDSLDVDNHRWIALNVKPTINVLCVDGRPSGGSFQGATDYLVYALEPRSAASGFARIHTDVVPESALVERDLAPYDCIFLADVAQFTGGEAQILDAYLRGGGGLVIFLGDRVMSDRYNRELGGRRTSGVDLLPARLGGVVDRPQTSLDPLDYRHPIVAPFRNRPLAGLLTTPVSKYIKLDIPKDSDSRVALAFGDGDPMIVERPVHQGRVVLVATSADTSWTPMPMWASYVPIIQELLAWAIGGQKHQRNLEVGQPLGLTAATSTADIPQDVRSPDGRVEEIHPLAERDRTGWTYDATYTSGIYTARFGPPDPHTESFAVNVDTVESDLARLTADQLRDEVLPDVPFVYQTTWDAGQEEPVAPIGRSTGLPKTLLYVALVLLLAETFLAWKFGHHRT